MFISFKHTDVFVCIIIAQFNCAFFSYFVNLSFTYIFEAMLLGHFDLKSLYLPGELTHSEMT